jgi:shikimate dehydrogenase
VAAPTARTRVAGVIGHPIAHSLSPTIFNAAFEDRGLDWVYVAFDVTEGGAGGALDAMRTLGLGGLSVTMPHKADVAAAVDELTPEARALGAVNCVVPAADGRLAGHNTDGAGFLAGLDADLGIDVAGREVVVLGAGGAARAIVAALAGAGPAGIAIVNRDPGRAAAAAALGGPRCRVAGSDALDDAEVVVNATSLGMAGVGGGAEGRLPADPARLPPACVVADIVYHPLETPFLLAARARGLRVANGVGMLIGQAAVAFRLWTGDDPPVAAMRAAVDARLSPS